MRRLLLVSLSLALIALATSGGSAAANRARSAIQCPVSAAGGCCPLVPQCCLPGPQAHRASAAAPCCTGGVQPRHCPNTITIAANPDPSTEGGRVKVSGQLFASSSAHVVVALWEKLSTQHAFHRVGHATTDSSGRYSISRRPGIVKTNRAWYVVANGVRSATLNERVHDRVSLTDSITTVANGERVTFRGQVTPNHAGERIVLEQRTAHGWTSIAHGPLDGASRFSIQIRFVTARQMKVRAVLGGDRRNIRSVSRIVTIF